MARSFNGTTQWLRMSAGAFASTNFGYGTLACIVKRGSASAAFHTLMIAANGSSANLSFGFDPGSNLINFISNGTTSTASTTTFTSTTTWYLMVWTKATGTVTPRYHWYNYTTGLWNHEAASGTQVDTSGVNVTNWDFGQWAAGTGDPLNGDMAAAGVFRTVVPANDAAVEAWGLQTIAANWLTLAGTADRAAVWLFNQASTSDPVLDVTGGGADQASGTVPGIAASDPAGFSYSLSGVTTDWLNPASDVTINSWTTDTGGTTNLYQAIDEDTASDADYVQSPAGAFTSSYYECGLESQVGDAGLSTDHTVSYRYQANAGAGSDITVSLRQGAGTEIAAWTHNNISTAWTQADQALTGTQANNITYPTDLRIRFEPNADGPATIAKVSDRGSLANSTAGATTLIDMAAAASITVGNYLVAHVSVTNSGGGGAAPGLTISDPRSNTWTVVDPANSLSDPGTVNSGTKAYMAYCKVDNAYTNGDDITFTWGAGTPTWDAIVISEWSGIHATSPVAVAAVGANAAASAAVSVAITPTATGQVIMTCLSTEGPVADTAPVDSSPTNGTWVSLTRTGTSNATATDNQTVAGQYNATATAGVSNVWDPSITARDWAAIAIVFAPEGAARVQVSWAGLTIPYAAPPIVSRPSARIIYQPAVQRAALW